MNEIADTAKTPAERSAIEEAAAIYNEALQRIRDECGVMVRYKPVVVDSGQASLYIGAQPVLEVISNGK